MIGDPVERGRLAEVVAVAVGLEVLVEGGPLGSLLDRAQPGEHLVAADGQLRDLLLYTHGHL
jgi:hypothetical protein